MPIGEYLEDIDAADLQQAKDEYGSYILSLEDKLDEAEACGKDGDMRMLTILSEFNDIHGDLEYYSTRAHESLSKKDYHATVKMLLLEYLVGIIAKEIATIQAIQKDGGDKHLQSRIQELENIIDFYIDLYPELNLGVWKVKAEKLHDLA